MPTPTPAAVAASVAWGQGLQAEWDQETCTAAESVAVALFVLAPSSKASRQHLPQLLLLQQLSWGKGCRQNGIKKRVLLLSLLLLPGLCTPQGCQQCANTYLS